MGEKVGDFMLVGTETFQSGVESIKERRFSFRKGKKKKELLKRCKREEPVTK